MGLGSQQRKSIGVPCQRFFDANLISVHLYAAGSVQRHYPEHRRVLCFIGDLGALERRNVQIVHITS